MKTKRIIFLSAVLLVALFCGVSSQAMADLCDQDADGYRYVGISMLGMPCEGNDCDDADANVHPDAPELCDAIDNNCDGSVDKEDSADATTHYPDTDADGYGSTAGAVKACTEPVGHVDRGGDCDDSDFLVSPGASEFCDAIDNDCDGSVDEGDSLDTTTYYPDTDADGYGSTAGAVKACTEPVGHVDRGGDCDDSDFLVSPGASEFCDGLDNNCDRLVDNDAIDSPFYFQDADADGFGNPGASVLAGDCAGITPPAGFVLSTGDCNDANPDVFAGAAEIWYDGIDQDCAGDSDNDADGDSHAAEDFGDDDCDDLLDSVFPGATEVCEDMIDQDCDGSDAACPGVAVCGDGVIDTESDEVCDDGGAGAACELDCSAVITPTAAEETDEGPESDSGSTGDSGSTDSTAVGDSGTGADDIEIDAGTAADTGQEDEGSAISAAQEETSSGGCSLNATAESPASAGALLLLVLAGVLTRISLVNKFCPDKLELRF